jgi:hypothetical protein
VPTSPSGELFSGSPTGGQLSGIRRQPDPWERLRHPYMTHPYRSGFSSWTSRSTATNLEGNAGGIIALRQDRIDNRCLLEGLTSRQFACAMRCGSQAIGLARLPLGKLLGYPRFAVMFTILIWLVISEVPGMEESDYVRTTLTQASRRWITPV